MQNYVFNMWGRRLRDTQQGGSKVAKATSWKTGRIIELGEVLRRR